MGVQSDEGDRCGPDADSWGWFKGERGVSALAVREGQPPHMCTHSTGLGLGREYNSPFQDAAQAGSPSLFGKGRGKLPVFLLLLPNRKMRMGSTPIVFLAIFCFLCPQSAFLWGHL